MHTNETTDKKFFVRGMKKFLFVIISMSFYYSTVYSQKNEHDIKFFSLDSLLNVQISSASKYKQKSFEAPSAVSIISSEEIEKFGYQTLGEVLSSLGGFYLSYDRNYSYLGVRGFSRPTDYNNRILVLINNHPTNEVVFGSSSMGTELGLPLSSIERIEVVRGPGSSLYGTGAMLSVVNIVTKKGKEFDKGSFSFRGSSLRSYSGSVNFGTEYENGVELFVSTEYFNQRGKDLYFEEYDHPSTNNGIAAGLDKDNYVGLYALINYKQLHFQGKYSTRGKYIPTASYLIDFNDSRAKTIDASAFSELSYAVPFGNDNKLTLSASLDYYDYTGTYPYGSSLLFDEGIATWTILNAQFDWIVSSSDHFIAGIEYKGNLNARYNEHDETGDLFNKDVQSSIRSIYLHNEYQPLPNISLIASLRYDDGTFSRSLFSPRGAVVYNWRNTALKLIYSSAYRSPNLYELYYEDEATNFKPSASLSAEKISTWEFVVEHKVRDNLFASLSIYRYKMHYLIDQKFNEADSSLQFINYGNVTTTGFETDLNYYPVESTRAFFRYSYHYAGYQEEKSNLSNSPKHLVRAGFVFPVFNTIYCAPEFFYESSRFTVYDTKTKNFLLVNLTLTTKTLFEIFKVSLSIKNLFNVTYKHPGGFEHTQPAITQDARNFFFRFQFDF